MSKAQCQSTSAQVERPLRTKTKKKSKSSPVDPGAGVPIYVRADLGPSN